MGLNMIDVIRFYYDIPIEFRRWMRWVLSTETARTLAAEKGINLDEVVDPVLMDRPVRIDDTVQGLSYEVVPT